MLKHKIIEASSIESLEKKFYEFTKSQRKTTVYNVQTHIIPTLTGMKFYISFTYAKQSSFAIGQSVGQA